MPLAALAIAALIALTGTFFIAPEQSRAQTVEISPILTMTLSGGSGTGTGDEGPDRLTRDKIEITVTSDEPLQEPPSISVVCNDIRWIETVGGEIVERNIDDFIANRSGQLNEVQSANFNYRCGEHENDITLETHAMTATGTMSWTYQWRNSTEAPHKLNDGLLTAVAHARDQPQYPNHDRSQVGKWNTATANFTLDTTFKSPLEPGGGYFYPANGSKTLEPHLGVTVKFTEPTAVTLQSFRVDGVSRLDEIQLIEGYWYSNAFSFWSPNLNIGAHVVEVSALDAAGNTVTFETRFESALRPPFILRLQPGWNAISFPARPVDNEIEAIFTDPAIRFVVRWLPFVGDDGHGPWLWSVRLQGEWKTLMRDDYEHYESGVDLLFGLWVYSEDAVSQPVRLSAVSDNCVGTGFPRGWVFRSVVDWDDDQIEDHFGQELSEEGDAVTAHRFLGIYASDPAYRWDAQNQRSIVLRPDDPVRIGEAIWVYYFSRAKTGSWASCP